MIKVAERNIIKNNIVPLYYNMKKAKSVHLDNLSIYNGLNAAFSGSNIGQYSNNISKIWNSEVFISGTEEEKQKAIDVIKLLCMENNFCIDEAKTLYMPKRPTHVKNLVSSFTKMNLPHFFKYAKDKEEWQVSNVNNSFVNKLNNIIPNPRLNFRKLGLRDIDYCLLMDNPNIDITVCFTDGGKLIKENSNPIVIKYCEMIQKYYLSDEMLKNNIFNSEMLKGFKLKQELKYKKIVSETKNELSKFGYSDIEITDILVKYLYGIKKSKHKTALWLCYGDIIFNNLSKHFKKQTKSIQCSDCGEWIEVNYKNTRTRRCEKCQKAYKTQYQKEFMQKKREIQCC